MKPEFKQQLLKCFWLCLPALIVAMVLRVALLVAIPESYYGPDSNSYFDAADRLWNKGELRFESKRVYAYPALLILAPPLPGNTLQVGAIMHTAFGLMTIFGVGWIVMHCTRFATVAVPLATLVTAVWPRMLWYEHELIVESFFLANFVAMVAVAMPLEALRNSRKRFTLFLLLAILLVAARPHGKPVWAGAMVAASLFVAWPWRWGWKNLAVLAVSIVFVLRTGSDSQGSWLMLSSALPFVKTEGERWQQYRDILRPTIEKTRADVANYPFEQVVYKKSLNKERGGYFGPQWDALVQQKSEFQQVAKGLAREGIRSNPVGYAILVLRKIAFAVRLDADSRFNPHKFWVAQEKQNTPRWEVRPVQMKLAYEQDQEAYNRTVKERMSRKFLFVEPMDKIASWLQPLKMTRGPFGGLPDVKLHWLAWMAIGGLLACLLQPGKWGGGAFVLIPASLYLAAVFAVGDALPRYWQPADWVLAFLAAQCVDGVLSLIGLAVRRMRPPSATSLPVSEIHEH